MFQNPTLILKAIAKHYRQTLLPNELIEKVVDRLTTKITLAVYEKFKDRILFAICVDSIECWLLPLFYQDQKAAKTQGCLEALNRQLRIQNQKIITDSKSIDTYFQISRPYAKQKNLLGVGIKNPSLSIFIEALKTINIEDFDD